MNNFVLLPIRKFYGYLKKDFLLLYKRKKYLYLFILLPLIIASLFLFALNPGDYEIDIAVCDIDNTGYSSNVIHSLNNFNPIFLNTEEDSCTQLMIEKIKSKEFDLGVVIPKGFSQNIENLKQSNIQIYYDNTDVAFSNLISWKIDQALNPFKKSVVDELNNELKKRVNSARQGADFIIDFSEFSPIANSKINELDKDLKKVEEMETEFIINPIYTTKKPIYNQEFKNSAGITFVFPIIALFILLLLASTSIIYDKKTGFITRIKSSTSPGLYLLAKTVFFVLLCFVQFLIILSLFLIQNSSYNFSIIEVIKLVIYIGVIDSILGFIIGFISDNEGIAVLFSLILAFPLMLISGIFFPIQTLPKILQWFAGILPLNYQINAVKSVLLFNQEISINWFYISLGMFMFVWWLAKRKG